MKTMTMVRLNKYIADSGISSRRKAEEFILQGRISVNNKIITDLSFKVDTLTDNVMFDGQKIFPVKNIYFLLNKPKGVVTTTSDERKRSTVLDLIKTNEKVYPVGRLDYNTTGVLFITNDGEFTNLLTHPGNNVPRVYEVKLDKALTEEDKAKLLTGIYINKIKGKFIKISFPKKNRNFVEVTAVEGRNHFVKNMFGALQYSVKELNRKSYAGISADIPAGSYRQLSLSEVKKIINKYGI